MLEHRIARRDLRDFTAFVANLDDVADADRTVEQDDEAGNVIAGDFLQAKTEADAQRTGAEKNQTLVFEIRRTTRRNKKMAGGNQ